MIRGKGGLLPRPPSSHGSLPNAFFEAAKALGGTLPPGRVPFLMPASGFPQVGLCRVRLVPKCMPPDPALSHIESEGGLVCYCPWICTVNRVGPGDPIFYTIRMSSVWLTEAESGFLVSYAEVSLVPAKV